MEEEDVQLWKLVLARTNRHAKIESMKNTEQD
jgi:hypothetical protein